MRVVKLGTRADNYTPLRKAEYPTQITQEEQLTAGEWIEPPADLRGFRTLVNNSDILPQCIRAYRHNIAGFGLGVRYIDDEEETPERAAEFERLTEIIDCLTLEDDTKEIFEDVIEARETYGIAYVEVIRNNDGEVTQLEFIKDTESMRKTRPLDYQDMTYYHHGQELVRKKKFRKYQQTVGGKTVYYKEFGDPRVMDNRDGTFTDEALEAQYQANEVIEFGIGIMPYGTVRWIGQILGVDGSRRAELLNNNYFTNGRHTPLAIIINGGTLTDDAYANLQTYLNDIQGENGQHAFLLLETEAMEAGTAFDQDSRPTVELKDLANILQKDELFQEYIQNNRKKVQSAFQLPDLYVGYTTDFNRATAQTAQEVTEEQVFQPERASLAWVLNNKILNGYQFRYVEAFFKEPNISNPDDLFKVLSVTNLAGGLTPNKAKEILYNSFGETSEDYEGEWGDIPLAITKTSQVSTPRDAFAEEEQEIENPGPQNAPPKKDETTDETEDDTDDTDDIDERIADQVDKAIAKAGINHEDEIVAVLKEVRRQLIRMGGEGE